MWATIFWVAFLLFFLAMCAAYVMMPFWIAENLSRNVHDEEMIGLIAWWKKGGPFA